MEEEERDRTGQWKQSAEVLYKKLKQNVNV